MKKLLGVIGIILGLVGCTFSNSKVSSLEDSLNKDLACNTIDFAQVQSEIFGTTSAPSGKCIQCHGPGSSLMILDSYAAVKARLVQIEDAVRSNRMPKNNPLSANLKQLLFTWVAQGAPEFADTQALTDACGPSAGEPGTQPPPLVLKPHYESLRELIFAPRCIDCHDSSGFISSYDFSSYESISSYQKLFKIPSDIEDSRFVKSLVSGSMPKDAKPLLPEQIQVIREWVALGLPRNEEELAEAIPTSTSNCVDYEFIKTKVLQPNCTRCHGVKGGVNLESYTNVKSHLNKVEIQVVTDQMPPKKSLDPDLKTHLLTWIKNGAPEKVLPGSSCQTQSTIPVLENNNNNNEGDNND